MQRLMVVMLSLCVEQAPEIIVFHGTTRTCAKSIARNGFEIRHVRSLQTFCKAHDILPGIER
jgi:hypothetical protein